MVEPRKYSLRAIDVVNEARTLLRAMADAGKRGLPRSREKLRRRRVYAVSMKTRPMPGARCSPKGRSSSSVPWGEEEERRRRRASRGRGDDSGGRRSGKSNKKTNRKIKERKWSRGPGHHNDRAHNARWLLARLLPLPQAEAGSRGSLTPCPCWLLLLPSSPRTKHQEILDVDEEAR